LQIDHHLHPAVELKEQCRAFGGEGLAEDGDVFQSELDDRFVNFEPPSG
jgi:hypothetical protein